MDHPTTGTPGDPVASVFAKRLRAAFWVVLSALAVTSIEDVWFHRDALPVLLSIKAALVAGGGLLAWGLRFRALRLRTAWVGLAGMVLTCTATVLLGVVRGDPSTARLLLIVIGLASVAVLPWGLGPQLAAAAIACISILASSYMAETGLGASVHQFSSGVVIAVGLLVYVTTRFVLYRRDTELQIREREVAEKALRASERYFRSLIEHGSDLIAVIDRDGTSRYHSPSYRAVLGLGPEDLDGASSFERVHPDDRERLRELLVRSVESGELVGRAEYRLRHKDGSWRVVEGVGTNLLDDPAVGGVVVNARDVTERRQMEAELRRSQAYSKALFEYAPDACYLNDGEGRFIDGNRACESLSGYERAELIGQSFLTLNLIDPPDLAVLAELLPVSLREATGPTEAVILRKDGGRVTADIHTIPVEINGRTLVLGIARDVSERKRAAAELARAKEAAEAANRAKSDFLANMSHEIRTPMTGIIGMTDLALESSVGEQREFLQMVKSCAESLLAVINDVLDFSKIEAGKLDLEEVAFPLRAYLDGCVDLLGVRARQKGLSLRAQAGAGVPEDLVGDPTRLRQVLVNLVGNAIKFTERGEITVGVEMDAGANSEAASNGRTDVMLHFTVRDTGIGIAPEKQEAIFGAFEQGDGSTARRYGGTGLGLTISARLVQLMGGRIWVESEVGRGSTFHFTVRCRRGRGEQAGAPHAGAVGSVASVGRAAELAPRAPRALHVLLAEDNAVNQKLMVRLLDKRGHTVVVADDGRKALAALEAGRFDIVLMDVQMPEMDGFEATAAIRDRERRTGAHVPIVAMTAHAMKGDAERCLEAGMDGYIAKPIQAAVLYELVERMAAPAPQPMDRGAAKQAG